MASEIGLYLLCSSQEHCPGVSWLRGEGAERHQSPEAMGHGDHLRFRLSGLRERDGLCRSKYTEARLDPQGNRLWAATRCFVTGVQLWAQKPAKLFQGNRNYSGPLAQEIILNEKPKDNIGKICIGCSYWFYLSSLETALVYCCTLMYEKQPADYCNNQNRVSKHRSPFCFVSFVF